MAKANGGPRKLPTDFRKRCRVPDFGKGFKLKNIDPGEKAAFPDRPSAETQMAADVTRIDALQDVMWAQGKHALLAIFQALDAGGKDGTIRKVFGPTDPLGVITTSFKKPTEREMAQDYLWRVHQVVPAKGMIGLFNRSHYEDVLVVRVHELAPPRKIEQRYDQINAFEKHLAENGVIILKFFLHISKEKQKERLQDRINDPTKRWKFPWYVIPADRNWYRNAVVARIVRVTLEEMDLQYPPAPRGIEKIVVE
jgi:PPK2 family polyphosphate:nucleotide phosphotransferase